MIGPQHCGQRAIAKTLGPPIQASAVVWNGISQHRPSPPNVLVTAYGRFAASGARSRYLTARGSNTPNVPKVLSVRPTGRSDHGEYHGTSDRECGTSAAGRGHRSFTRQACAGVHGLTSQQAASLCQPRTPHRRANAIKHRQDQVKQQ